MDNYLCTESAIIDRVKGQVPSLKGVFSASDLDGVTEAQQITPAAHVLYLGDKVIETSNGRSALGDRQEVDQVWAVVLAVRNARTQITGEAARADAGPLIVAILKALQGWKPETGFTPLKRTNAPGPGFKSGFGYFPLYFTTRVSI